MKHARPDYERIQDPAGLIPDDEPVFLIRGQDAAAPVAVAFYADAAEAYGADPTLVAAVLAHVEAMKEWQKKHGKKVPDLPSGGAVP